MKEPKKRCAPRLQIPGKLNLSAEWRQGAMKLWCRMEIVEDKYSVE